MSMSKYPTKLAAVIFDWAGTVVDFGSLAPMGVFVEAFQRFGVTISIEEARLPMGLPKRAHVAALMTMPRVSEAWAAAQGSPPGEAEIDALYEVLLGQEQGPRRVPGHMQRFHRKKPEIIALHRANFPTIDG